MPTLEYEKEMSQPVMGIDEAGRGPLAGPVVAAAVSVPLALAESLIVGDWSKVNDSKKLTAAVRDSLACTIKTTKGCLWAIASASPQEIDRLNILKATHLAMRRAALSLAERYGSNEVKFSILVDGLAVPSLPFPSRNLVKGDSKSLLVAAASILAKTARDEYCKKMDAAYPEYGFSRHKGYPTPEHLDVLRRLGPCSEHRRSFAPVMEQWLF